MSIFGFSINIGEIWLVLWAGAGGAFWSAYELRKAMILGEIGFMGQTFRRVEDRLLFNLYRGFWATVLLCSTALLVVYFLNLGFEP